MAGKLAFVIPLAKAEVVRSWQEVLDRFEATVRSASNQLSDAFEIIVVGHTRPSRCLDNPKVRFIEVDYPLTISTKDRPEIPAYPEKEIRFTDMGRKRLRGLLEAERLEATHVMFLDADDLVSKRLATVVTEHPEEPGWIFETGYRYNVGKSHIHYKPRKFHMECHSAFVLRTDLIPQCRNPEYDRGFDYYRFLINHTYIAEKMRRIAPNIKALPFPGAVYIIHGSNDTASIDYRNGFSKLRGAITDLFLLRPISTSLAQEFSLKKSQA